MLLLTRFSLSFLCVPVCMSGYTYWLSSLFIPRLVLWFKVYSAGKVSLRLDWLASKPLGSFCVSLSTIFCDSVEVVQSHLQLWKRHEGECLEPWEAGSSDEVYDPPAGGRNGSWEHALLAVPAALNKMVIVLLCPEDSILHMTDDVSNNCC